MRPMMKVVLPALCLGLHLYSLSALAEPTLYPTNLGELKKIQNTTNSNILADEQDVGTIWVMPPNTATAVASGYDPKSSANLGFCAEMGDLQRYSRERSSEINELMLMKKKETPKLIELAEKAAKLEQEAQAFAIEKSFGPLSELDTRIAATEDRLSELYRVSERCEKHCDKVGEEIDGLVKAKEVMLTDRNTLAGSTTKDLRDYNKKLKAAQGAKAVYLAKRNVYGDLADDLRAVQEKFKQSYLLYGGLYGGSANFRYVSSWDDNITVLRKANPSINFQKIKTQNAVLMTAIAGVKDLDPTGAIKNITVPGGLAEGLGTYRYPAYPESVVSKVDLTLIGGCPMAYPDYFEKAPAAQGEVTYGLIISYDYQTVFKMKASATYNMYKMYQKIVSSGSSGGLFSSRSWSNVEEKNLFTDSFTVVWNDKENTVPKEEKEEREAEMRKSVLIRLATQAIPETPSKVELLAAIAPGPHGSIVLADGLAKTCGFNVYCQGAGIVLRVLDAIFGSSSSSSSYTKINKAEISENYEVDQKITKSWVTSYL